MSAPTMLMHMLLERLHRRELPRVLEPDLIMNDPAQVEAFAAMGREDGLLAPFYVFHSLHAASAIRPGDQVLDLACGPCNQLAQFAELHPDTRFLGVDVADNMLALGQQTLRRRGVTNVHLRREDACTLASVPDASIDCVTCTMSLHHLPDEAALARTMAAVRRVLKPGGGLYLADFGRLRRRATQHYFAHDRVDEQPPLFTADFLHSMRAAFSASELAHHVALLGPDIARHETMLAPFLVVFRRPTVARPAPRTLALAQGLLRRLTPTQQRDFQALSLWFRASGLTSAFDLTPPP